MIGKKIRKESKIELKRSEKLHHGNDEDDESGDCSFLRVWKIGDDEI